LVALVVSGGHTSLYVVAEAGVYRRVGRTRRRGQRGLRQGREGYLTTLGPVVDRRARGGRSGHRVSLGRGSTPIAMHRRSGISAQLQRAQDCRAAPSASARSKTCR
jgi:hypothetical protein